MIEKGFHQLLVTPETDENTAPLGVLSKRHLIDLMGE
jgi:hypothetical protein